MKKTAYTTMTLIGLLAMSACATNGVTRQQSDAASLQAYMDAAGAPVQRFNKFGASLHSWESFNDNEHLVVYSHPRTAYLLRISPCPDLGFARAINVSDSMGQVQTKFDRVYPLGTTAAANIGCPIQSIQPIDIQKYKTLTAAFQKARIAQ